MGFAEERTVKAVRKAHTCDGCRRRIELGQPATRWAGMTDGQFASAHYHPDCREAEVALNEALGWRGGDDWFALSDIETEDHVWLVQTYPAVAERMQIKLPDDAVITRPA